MLPSLRLCRAFALALTFNIVCSSPVDDLPLHKGRPWTVGQAVNTTSGTIIGHAATNTTQVSEYLGIRYAEPPVGDLRFAAPKAYKSNATYNAVNFVSIMAYEMG
jgi:cholinesterase